MVWLSKYINVQFKIPIVLCIVDLAGDYAVVKRAFDNAIKEMGPLYMLVNCAGMAICGTLEDHTSNDVMVFGIYYGINIVVLFNYS